MNTAMTILVIAIALAPILAIFFAAYKRKGLGKLKGFLKNGLITWLITWTIVGWAYALLYTISSQSSHMLLPLFGGGILIGSIGGLIYELKKEPIQSQEPA